MDNKFDELGNGDWLAECMAFAHGEEDTYTTDPVTIPCPPPSGCITIVPNGFEP